MVCVYMMMEKQSPIMIGLYGISSLSSCCLLFLVKRPILCLTGTTRTLNWAGPYQGCWDNVFWSILFFTVPSVHMVT